MSDLGRERDHDRFGEPDEDRLPWLEPVEEQPAEQGVSAARLIVALVVALVALGLVVGGVYWLKQRANGEQQVASAEGTTIPAPADSYKVKPDEPGGMQVAGKGDSSYAASEGAEVNGQIDLSATPEAPVARPAPAAKAPAAAPAPATPAPATPAKAPPAVAEKKPVTPAPKPAAPAPAPVRQAATPAAGGSQVQLGAFDSRAKADGAWKAMSGRFAVLSGLTPSIVAADVKGRTFYRLRVPAGAKAGEICAKLKVAGESCAVIG